MTPRKRWSLAGVLVLSLLLFGGGLLMGALGLAQERDQQEFPRRFHEETLLIADREVLLGKGDLKLVIHHQDRREVVGVLMVRVDDEWLRFRPAPEPMNAHVRR